MSILIENGSNVNQRDKLGATALHRAASQGHMQSITFLLQCNMCEVDPTDIEGNTPL